ncbi:MAG: dihydrolipoamide acetyltransferase family protein [Thermodesulfobacteriota bacterium]
MIAEIRVPKLGMTQGDITVIQWCKAEGEMVAPEETVVIIETAKVSYEVPAPASGLVFRLKKVKDKVRIGEVLGVVADTTEAFAEYRGALPAAVAGAALGAAAPAAGGGLFEDQPEERGVRLVFEEEGEAHPPAARPAPAAMTVDLAGRRILQRRPFLGMRRTIANNLMASLQTGAQLTVVAQADLTEFTRFRDEFRLDRPEIRLTYVDMLVKVLPAVLKEFPLLNSTVVGDEIICWDEYHIGVAVALDDGLVVPVVRDADRKSLTAVSQEIKKLARKARAGELQPSDYQGGTFTLSSGGQVEVEIITPIINPPENAILALGKIGPAPAVYQGQLAVRTMTHLCLTHDHRVIDGVPAALFLGRLKEVIQNPDQFRKILR